MTLIIISVTHQHKATVAIDVVCHTIVELVDVLGGASSSSLHSHSLLLRSRQGISVGVGRIMAQFFWPSQ
eukprot:COSAG01_NODE_72885_length_251_cov_2.927632_1_plen_69_part_01